MNRANLRFVPKPVCPFCKGEKCDNCANTGISLGRPTSIKLKESTRSDINSLEQKFHKVDPVNFISVSITKFICPDVCLRERIVARIQFFHLDQAYYFCYGCNTFYRPVTDTSWEVLDSRSLFGVRTGKDDEVEVTGVLADKVTKYLDDQAKKAAKKFRRPSSTSSKVKY